MKKSLLKINHVIEEVEKSLYTFQNTSEEISNSNLDLSNLIDLEPLLKFSK